MNYLENVEPIFLSNAYYLLFSNHGYCFDSDAKFIPQSNDCFYLIQNLHHQIPSINNSKYIYIDEIVVPLITHFNTGVHAYSGIFSILMNYRKLFKDEKICKFVVNKNVQKGLLEIINSLFPSSDIIQLDENITYKFKKIILIPNSLHSFLENRKITEDICKFINSNFIKKDTTQYKKYKSIALLKTKSTSLTSSFGEISDSDAVNFCKRVGYELVNPYLLGEVELINILHNCENVIFSWGSTFIKNYIYLSEKCRRSDVLIYSPEFKYEYSIALNRAILPESKNCKFYYHIEPDLDQLKL